MTKYRVIDTNVLRVADRKNERASPRCIMTCIQALQDAKNELVLIDDGDLIMSEYRRGITEMTMDMIFRGCNLDSTEAYSFSKRGNW